MDGFKQLLDDLSARLGELSLQPEGACCGDRRWRQLISVIAIFSVWLRRRTRRSCSPTCSPEDASAALEELAKQDVEAELTNGGAHDHGARARGRTACASTWPAKGVPSNGTVGFEIFDGKQYGLTEFLQNVNFKRALEGELTKSILSLQGIQSARVHLVLPQAVDLQEVGHRPPPASCCGSAAAPSWARTRSPASRRWSPAASRN